MRLARVGLEVCLVLGPVLAATGFAARAQSFTGTVSDAMCGAKHMMEGDPAACLRACVQKGNKVYTLDTKDPATLASLDKLANQKATVRGQANGDQIEVSSVTSAK